MSFFSSIGKAIKKVGGAYDKTYGKVAGKVGSAGYDLLAKSKYGKRAGLLRSDSWRTARGRRAMVGGLATYAAGGPIALAAQSAANYAGSIQGERTLKQARREARHFRRHPEDRAVPPPAPPGMRSPLSWTERPDPNRTYTPRSKVGARAEREQADRQYRAAMVDTDTINAAIDTSGVPLTWNGFLDELEPDSGLDAPVAGFDGESMMPVDSDPSPWLVVGIAALALAMLR